MIGSSASVTADDSQSVGVVHQDVGVVLLRQGHDLRQRGDVAFHRVDAVYRDEFGGVLRGDAEFLLEAAHVVVRELEGLAEAKARAVDDAGVIQGVEEHEPVSEAEAAHHSQIGLEAGAVGHSFVFADELCELFFELQVDIQRAVQETGSRAARTVFFNGFDCGLLKPRVVRKAKVGIASEHQNPLAVHIDDWVLPRFDRPVVGIDPHGLHFLRQGVLTATRI